MQLNLDLVRELLIYIFRYIEMYNHLYWVYSVKEYYFLLQN